MKGLQAYRFSTNILGVNRTIHDEAEEMMYKRNIFVVLSYPSSSLEKVFGGLTWVPMVSKKHAGRMQLHSLQVHFDPDTTSSAKFPVESCIILAQDLQAFVCAARPATVHGLNPGPAVTVILGTGMPAIRLNPAALAGRKASSTRCLCELRETKYRSMDEGLQNRLLTPLATVTSLSQRVVFQGAIRNRKKLAHLKQLMAPSVESTEAYFTWEVGACIMALDVANSAIEHDELVFVLGLQCLVYHRLETVMHQPDVYSWALNNCPKILELLETFLFEIAVNIACGYLKVRHSSNYDFWFEQARTAMFALSMLVGDYWVIPPEMRAYRVSLRIWFALYIDNQAGHTVKDAVARLESVERDPRQEHDLAMLKRFPDQEANLSEEVLPFDQCSISQLPYSVVSFHKHFEGVIQSMQAKGWHNIEGIRSLDSDSKMAINTLQKEYRLQVTDFDLLNVEFGQ